MPRMLGEVLISVAIAYGAVLALVFLFQSRLVYYPEIGREVAATPKSYGLQFDQVEIRTSDGETLQAWWVPATDARATVLFFHGNAGNISHRLDYLLMFNRLRFSTLIVDYRGYGKSTGSPSEEGTYRDAEAAWNYLRDMRQAKPRDVVIAGESLGGAVAAWLAAYLGTDAVPARGKEAPIPFSPPESGWGAREVPRAVLLFSTFTSATDLGAEIYWFLPVRLISRVGYENLENLARIRAPVFIAHSRQDDVVPFTHGKKLFDSANEPKTFLEMSGGHNEGFIFTRPEWVAQLAAFLDRHVGEKSSTPQTH
jgi:fermentation-respiration switch protein FrsA (DUF1100 family)